MYPSIAHADSMLSNSLLHSLPQNYHEKLRRHMDYSVLESGRVLYEAGESIRHIYFPTSGIVSLLTITEDGCCSELAMTGRDGLVGFPVLLGDNHCPLQTLVRADGGAYRIPVDLFLREIDSNDLLRDVSYRYLYSLIYQMSENAACNQHHRVEEHLARWVLNNAEILGSPELQITQEGIATMLGVRREAISEAIGKLNRAGLVEHGRGWIRLKDKAGMEARACGCYRSSRNGISSSSSGTGLRPPASRSNQDATFVAKDSAEAIRPATACMASSGNAQGTQPHAMPVQPRHISLGSDRSNGGMSPWTNEDQTQSTPSRHFMDVYEFSPIAQVTIDQNLKIMELNLAAAILLEERKTHLLGRSFDQFAESPFLNGLRLFCNEVLDGRGQTGFELYLRPTSRQGPRRVRIEAVADEDGEECRMVLIHLSS